MNLEEYYKNEIEEFKKDPFEYIFIQANEIVNNGLGETEKINSELRALELIYSVWITCSSEQKEHLR